MAFRYDSYDSSIVIDGFENGIADSPYAGISDMRNVNISTVPGEASVGFATSKVSADSIADGTVVSANASTDYITYTGASNLERAMAIVFIGGSLPTGITAGTVYWVKNLNGAGAGTFQICASINSVAGTAVDITATGTGTFQVYNMGIPRYFTYDSANDAYWLIDSGGQVWTNAITTGTNNYWVFAGNAGGGGNSIGNGIVYYKASNGTGYIFSFRNSAIDFTPATLASISWTYGWNPSDATTGNAAGYLKTGNTTQYWHEVIVAPDSRVYYIDSNWVGRWYQTDPNVAFVPTTRSTYTFDQTQLLPTTDVATCITFLGTNILIGGTRNIIYPWDRFSTNFLYPILLSENYAVKMITVNTSTYIFAGQRGKIYVTNGSQVSLFKKLPDHISGTIEPYISWQGVGFNRNQLYFGVSVVNNGVTATINQYAGLWAIDLTTGALRMVNKLSFDTYTGYVSATIAIQDTPPSPDFPPGAGLYIGWSNASVGGIDKTSSSPYTGSQAIIDSDLIPIGTFNKPREGTQIEYKLSRPLVAGESITIKTRLIFDTSDTGYTTTLTDSTAGNYSGTANINYKNAQWVQFQIVLNSTTTNPSYVRLREIRLLGMTGQTLSNVKQFSL